MHGRFVISIFAATVIAMTGAGPAHAQFKAVLQKAQPLYREDTVTICLTGDVMMHQAQIENAHKEGKEYDFTQYFMHIRDRISSADIAIANMEFTLAGEPYSGYPAFSAPDSYAEYLADCGFDVFLAANNHIFDKGSKGAERTLKKYAELNGSHGIRYCGLSAGPEDMERTYPLMLNVRGIMIAIVNITYGTNLGTDTHWPKVNYQNDRIRLKKALADAERADFTLVLPHWGNEYELTHSKQQRETAQWLIDNGADMIIGTHPHVVQDFEIIDGVPVAYSLGNIVSNMSAANTQLGLMASIRLVREADGDIKVLPAEFTWLWCSRPGGYSDSYTVLPVREHLDRRKEWNGAWEHDKMTSTCERVRKATGIDAL